MANFSEAPPEKFSFQPASELDKKPEDTQISTLIYSMGDEADNTLSAFTMSGDDKKMYVFSPSDTSMLPVGRATA